MPSNTDPGLGNFTQDEVNRQVQSVKNQLASNRGVDPSQLTPEEQAQAAQTASGQMQQDDRPRDKPFYGNVTGYTQQQIDRSRQMGADAAGRAAYQQNFGDYNAGMSQGNYDRGQQQHALQLQQQAALGNAPSRAEILGKQMADQGIASQMAMAGSARGGALAQAAAMRNAQGGQAAYMQNATNQMAGLRAQEMAQARDAYQQGATGMRQQDYLAANTGLQKTGLETQNELAQRGMNDAQQRFYEGQANNVYTQQLSADLGGAQLAQNQNQFDTSRSDDMWKTGIGTGASVVGAGLLLSDFNTKDLVPMPGASAGSMGSSMSSGAQNLGAQVQMAGGAQSPEMSPDKKMALFNLAGQIGRGVGTMFSDSSTKQNMHPLMGPSRVSPRAPSPSLSDAVAGLDRLKAKMFGGR